MATQSARIEALESSIAAILAAVGGNAPADESDDTATVKAGSRTSRAKDTAAKSTVVKRNLDPIMVECDDDIAFSVVAAGVKSGPFRNGARVVPFKGGNKQASLSREHVLALADHADDVVAAMDTVDKRAKLGEHSPQES